MINLAYIYILLLCVPILHASEEALGCTPFETAIYVFSQTHKDDPSIAQKVFIADDHLCIPGEGDITVTPHYSEFNAFNTLAALVELKRSGLRFSDIVPEGASPELRRDLKLYCSDTDPDRNYTTHILLGRLLLLAYEENPTATIPMFYEIINLLPIFLNSVDGPMAADLLEKYRNTYEHNLKLLKQHCSPGNCSTNVEMKINAFLESKIEYQAMVDSLKSEPRLQLTKQDIL